MRPGSWTGRGRGAKQALVGQPAGPGREPHCRALQAGQGSGPRGVRARQRRKKNSGTVLAAFVLLSVTSATRSAACSMAYSKAYRPRPLFLEQVTHAVAKTQKVNPELITRPKTAPKTLVQGVWQAWSSARPAAGQGGLATATKALKLLHAPRPRPRPFSPRRGRVISPSLREDPPLLVVPLTQWRGGGRRG